MAKRRRCARHVRSHSDSPEAKLIVRQKISGEREQQRENHEQYADAPVEFARTLVRAGHEDAEHVQPYGHDHQVRSPAVHVAKQAAEWNVVLEIENVAEGLYLCRMVIKHQANAGENQNDEKIESDSAHAPGVTVTGRVAIYFGGVDVEEKIIERGKSAVARLFVMLDAKDRTVELGLLRLLQLLDLLLSFDLDDLWKALQVFENGCLLVVPVFLVRRHFFSSAFAKKI